mmetsp:Transcript_55447/g.127491  ORF Transcript_55447/g.127491 Transcript_55447/m.127491 type:complete len:1349 (-) Transcript_55447:135-4181(-)
MAEPTVETLTAEEEAWAAEKAKLLAEREKAIEDGFLSVPVVVAETAVEVDEFYNVIAPLATKGKTDWARPQAPPPPASFSNQSAIEGLQQYTEGFASFQAQVAKAAAAQTPKDMVAAAQELLKAIKACRLEQSLALGVILSDIQSVYQVAGQEAAGPLLSVLTVFEVEDVLSAMMKMPTESGNPKTPVTFAVLALLIRCGYFSLGQVWSRLAPAESELKSKVAELWQLYRTDSTRTVIGLSKQDTKRTWEQVFAEISVATHPKLALLSTLIDLNCWGDASAAMARLQTEAQFLPALNEVVRMSLTAATYWVVHPLVVACHPVSKLGLKPATATPAAAARMEAGTRPPSVICLVRKGKGLAAAPPRSGSGAEHLSQASTWKEAEPLLNKLCSALNTLLGLEIPLLTDLWRVVEHVIVNEPAEVATVQAFISQHLFPASCLVPHSAHLSDQIWQALSQLPCHERYTLYGLWDKSYSRFPLGAVGRRTSSGIKQILKRVVNQAEKTDMVSHQVHFHSGKFYHSNPLHALEAMIGSLQYSFNVNFIGPYIDCTTKMLPLASDVLGYLLTRCCVKSEWTKTGFLRTQDATVMAWLTNLGQFSGSFYRKHPGTDMAGMMKYIVHRISEGSSEEGDIYKPVKDLMFRVIIEQIIEHTGGYQNVADLNDEQLKCLAGGSKLRSESLAAGSAKDDTSRKAKARIQLRDALVQDRLVLVLWGALSRQRKRFYISEEKAAAQELTGAALKLQSMLFDGAHSCLLQVTEFLMVVCEPTQYATLLPSYEELFALFPVDVAFTVLRHALPDYSKSQKQPLQKPPAMPLPVAASPASPAEKTAIPSPDGSPQPDAPNGTETASAGDAPATGDVPMPDATEQAETQAQPKASQPVVPNPAYIEEIVDSDPVIQAVRKAVDLYIPFSDIEGQPGPKLPGLGRSFYLTFWRLSLSDIVLPTQQYETRIKAFSSLLTKNENDRKPYERREDTSSREYRTLKKECKSLEEAKQKLEEEFRLQKERHELVLKRLQEDKEEWFWEATPAATNAFVEQFILPRVLTSAADALFCCHFVKLIIELKTPGFQLLDFFNRWTLTLTRVIRRCSEREAQVFGVYLADMMSYIVQLRRNPKQYATVSKDNPCFYRNYYQRAHDVKDVKYTRHEEFEKGHTKWEGRIFKELKAGMESQEFVNVRNALVVLSKARSTFPLVDRCAKECLAKVENIKNEEQRPDVKTLAASLATVLKHNEPNWLRTSHTKTFAKAPAKSAAGAKAVAKEPVKVVGKAAAAAPAKSPEPKAAAKAKVEAPAAKEERPKATPTKTEPSTVKTEKPQDKTPVPGEKRVVTLGTSKAESEAEAKRRRAEKFKS